MTVKEIELLKETADRMGITYHAAIGVKKLKAKIDAILKDEPEELVEEVVKTVAETKAARNARLRREANRLVRVNISCLNPSKSAWQGEVYSASNAAIGVIKKFIPFKSEVAYHIPVILLDILKDSVYQRCFMEMVNGVNTKRSKLIKEFSIEELPPLTQAEIDRLAAKQALQGGTA